MKCHSLKIVMTVMLSGLLGAVKAASASPSDPAYLSTSWFHRGPDVNLLSTSAGVRVAVDNEGRYLADDSITGKNNRFARLDLDSLQKCNGEYYLAMPGGYQGRSSFTWFRVSQGGKCLDAPAIADRVKAREAAFASFGFYVDYDTRYGVPGLMLFPKAGLAVQRARETQDAAAFSIVPFSAEASPKPFGTNDNVELAFESSTHGRKRSTGIPTGVIADLDGLGFWCVSTNSGNLSTVHARPGVKPDGGRTLNLSKMISVGDAAIETFESGVASNDQLYLLLSRPDKSIGGVAAKRRLVCVSLADGKVVDTSLSLTRYINDAALAICGHSIVAYAQDQLVVMNRDTLGPEWTKDVASLTNHSLKGYGIYRVTANAAGTQMAVGLATAYRHPDEPTGVVLLADDGTIRQNWSLKPGSIDDMTFTNDGGLLLFSGAYTVKLGGSTAVRETELASISKADKNTLTESSDKSAANVPAKIAYVSTPLEERHKLWFSKPGGIFLPLGNGTLGAMMYGDTATTRVILDVDSAWDGSERKQGTFQSLGEVNFRLGHDPKEVTDFRRDLDLRTGLSTMTYRYQGVTYKTEAFCSHPHGLLVIRLTADKPGSLSGELELASRQMAKFTKSKNGIEFSGEKSNGQKVACVMCLDAQGGEVLPEAGKDGERDTSSKFKKNSEPYNSVMVKDCDSLTLYVAGDTDYAMNPANHFKGVDPEKKIASHIANIGKISFDQMKAASMADVCKLFDRCTLDLATNIPESETLPVDQRRATYLNKVRSGGAIDVGFQALAFDAARYMMIACSRPGSLPANLQGLWNEGNGAAWTGDYHTDINIEMNYWFVEPANLSECAVPLFDYIESQIPFWRKKAKANFGENVRGWTVEYMNNIFGGGTYMNYPAGSAWLSWHYAQHFEFGQDLDFLKSRAYPVLKELSEHWQDLAIRRPDGLFTTPKTSSPEHGPFQYGIAQDREMVCQMLTDYLSESTRLQCDADFAKQVENLRAGIVPPKIGRWGQLQEWEVDRDSRYCWHRHMMHVFAAFPGRAINPSDTPELAAAAIKSLKTRGDGSASWSKAWRASLYARLHQPDLAYQALSTVVGTFEDNLISAGKHQIDAPCGYASGVCEMLLQSYKPLDTAASRFEIDLLPALPKEWPTGSVKGLRARGGYEVDIDWKDGKLTKAMIRNVSSPESECTVRYGKVTTKLAVPKGESKKFTGHEK